VLFNGFAELGNFMRKRGTRAFNESLKTAVLQLFTCREGGKMHNKQLELEARGETSRNEPNFSARRLVKSQVAVKNPAGPFSR